MWQAACEAAEAEAETLRAFVHTLSTKLEQAESAALNWRSMYDDLLLHTGGYSVEDRTE